MTRRHILRAPVLRALGFLLALLPTLAAAQPKPRLELKSGDRVLLLGDTLMEREQHHGWIEVMLTTRFADRDVTFRNLGWSGDTPAGDSRVGLSLLQAGHEPADEGWKQLARQLAETKPTVVLLGYGMASSFAGLEGLPQFNSDYRRLLDAIKRTSPGARVVLLGPVRHEMLGASWPDSHAHNRNLDLYAAAIRALADERRLEFVSLSALGLPGEPDGALTQNGVHLNAAGYRRLAERLEESLFGERGAWRTSAQTEVLRQAILRKNEGFFFRSRPGNMAYIFGFRKREQGKNAGEMSEFDQQVAADEKRIAQLRSLQPVQVPEIPLRTGNRSAAHTEQPHPRFEVAEGFEVTLWAENPLLNKPIQMNFDPQGRLWVASSEVYPQIEPGQAATDKIIVLADTTGDGRADQATVFADGLLIPTGVAPGDGGVYVAQSTELLFLKDNDGDGRADERRVVLSGFGTEDTHHNLHTLRWGPDGRLYLNQSTYTRSAVETPHGVVALKAGGVFRFDPRNEQMDVIYRGWSNSWGHQFDDYGQSFFSDGAGFLGLSWGLPEARYGSLRPGGRVMPTISAGNYPKFCGLEIVQSKNFPADWQGDVITCDFRAHRVVRFKLSAQGAAYATQEMPDVLRTVDATFRPIDVQFGPDGALYVADWSNPIIQHGEVDFRDPRRDKEHGRIWRIARKGSASLPIRNLAKLESAALLDLLNSSEGYERTQARRLLVERGAPVVMPELVAWTARQTDEKARLQAWQLHVAFNAPAPALEQALLASPDAGVRAAMIRTLRPGDGFEVLAKLADDESPHVRIEAIRALRHFKTARAAEIVLNAVERPMDPFLDYAIWLTLNELAEPWLAAVKSGTWKTDGRERQLEFGLKAVEPGLAAEVLAQVLKGRVLPRDGAGPWLELIGTAGRPQELRSLFDQLGVGRFSTEGAVRALTALSGAARLRATRPTGDLTSLGALLGSPEESVRVAALALAGAWKISALAPEVLRAVRTAGRAERSAALAALREIGGREVIAGLGMIAGSSANPALRRDAVVVLASLDLTAAWPDALALLALTSDEKESQDLWRGLLGVRGVGERLAVELPKVGLPAAAARAGLRPAREGGRQSALVPVLLKLAGLSLTNAHLSEAELRQFAHEALERGDAARGERIYRRAELACTTCHAIGGAGGRIGPDLTSIGASAPADYLIESLLNPSAKIKEGYHAVLLTTRDAREFSGMVVKETAAEVVLRDAANRDVSIPVRDITRRNDIGSLMPAGLIDGLLPEERFDLVKFLSRLGQRGEFDAAKGGVARAWKLYVVVNKNQHLGIERVVRGDFSLNDWVPALTLVSGVLPRETLETAYPARGLNARGLFAAARFEASQAGAVAFALAGDVKEAWVNGLPVKVGAHFSAEVRAGANVVVLLLDDVRIPEGIRLSSEMVTFAGEL